MVADKVIAGMWGTTNLKLFLLEGVGGNAPKVIEHKVGPGASQIDRSEFEKTLNALVGNWLVAYPSAPIVLSGMVGSTIGWKNTGYRSCPVSAVAVDISEHFNALDRDVFIARGLSCINVYGRNDILRGEETELVGLMNLEPHMQMGRHLVCIPGTHAKWVMLKNGQITHFLTSLAGELFEALTNNGVLVPKGMEMPRKIDSNFRRGLKETVHAKASLIHQLFSVRAGRVVGEHDDPAAIQKLSGMIIGADIEGALQHFSFDMDEQFITVIGAPEISSRYAEALRLYKIRTKIIDAGQASVAGLWALSQSQKRKQAV